MQSSKRVRMVFDLRCDSSKKRQYTHVKVYIVHHPCTPALILRWFMLSFGNEKAFHRGIPPDLDATETFTNYPTTCAACRAPESSD